MTGSQTTSSKISLLKKKNNLIGKWANDNAIPLREMAMINNNLEKC